MSDKNVNAHGTEGSETGEENVPLPFVASTAVERHAFGAYRHLPGTLDRMNTLPAADTKRVV